MAVRGWGRAGPLRMEESWEAGLEGDPGKERPPDWKSSSLGLMGGEENENESVRERGLPSRVLKGLLLTTLLEAEGSRRLGGRERGGGSATADEEWEWERRETGAGELEGASSAPRSLLFRFLLWSPLGDPVFFGPLRCLAFRRWDGAFSTMASIILRILLDWSFLLEVLILYIFPRY